MLLATSGCGKAEEGPGNATDTDGTGGEAALPPEEDPTEILGRPVTFREGIELHDVEFDGTQFIAVGVSGTFHTTEAEGFALGARSLVLRSTDGNSWTRVFESTSGPILDVVFAHGQYLAVGSVGWAASLSEFTEDAIVLTSEDGEDWSPRPGPADNGLITVIAAESGFIAASLTTVWKSASGVSWTEQMVPLSAGYILAGLARSQGITLAYSPQQLFRSLDDGTTWEQVPPFGRSEGLPDTHGAYWATPEGFAGSTRVPARNHVDVTSSDGLSWIRTERDGDASAVLQVIGSPQVTLRRTTAFEAEVELVAEDGSWVSTLEQSNALAYGNGLFVAVGPGGTHSSVDGVTWQPGTVVSE